MLDKLIHRIFIKKMNRNIMKGILAKVFILFFVLHYNILFASSKKDGNESLDIDFKVGIHQDFVRIVFFLKEDYLKSSSVKKIDNIIKIEFNRPVNFNLIKKGADKEIINVDSTKELIKGLFIEAKKDSCIIKSENFFDLKTMRLNEPSRLVVDIYMGRSKIEKDSNIFRANLIMVDPGHGGFDRGIHTNNLVEKNFVLDFSKNFKDIAEKRGKKILFTRNGDYAMSLTDRIRAINKRRPEFLISIHISSGNELSIYIPEKILKKENEDLAVDLYKYSEAISKSISERIKNQLGVNVKIEKANSIIGSYLNIPSILVELPNPERFAYDKKINLKITNAILDGLSQELKDQE